MTRLLQRAPSALASDGAPAPRCSGSSMSNAPFFSSMLMELAVMAPVVMELVVMEPVVMGQRGRDGLLRREQQEEKRTGDGRSGGRGGGKGRSCNRRSRSNSLAHAMLCWAGPAAYQYSRAHTAAHYYRMSSRRRRRRRRWRHWRLPCYRKLQSGMVRNMARTEQSNRFQCGAVPCDSVHSSSTFCFCQTPAQKQFQCRHR